MNIAIYLRKSRADEELEKTIGEGETLAKHRKALLKFAKEKGYNIVEIKEEIVSGESLFHRPKMLELLEEVGNKEYSGVLVMDMQRLGRGDMQDQGIILKTFKDSNTKIITPQKTYDLNNDFDEEYSEFEAFMSRKELKMINRRMQGGRIRSLEEGNYIATNAPYGYDIEVVKRSRTLRINEDEKPVVKLIFDMYCSGKGAGAIATYLNSFGYKTKVGRKFSSSSVLFIIKNPVYIGKITWKKKEIKKSNDPYKVKDTRTRDKSEWIVVEGKHNPIIDEGTFNKATEIINKRYHIPYKLLNGPANPLAGVLICGICGSKMILRKYGKGKAPHVICKESCGCKSSRFDFVEKDILDALQKYYNDLILTDKNSEESDNSKAYKPQLATLNKTIEALNQRKNRIFEFYELGTYDTPTFIDRSKKIEDEVKATKEQIENITELMNKKEKKSNLKERIKTLLGVYQIADVSEKNELLKNALIKAVYTKTKSQRNDDFHIDLFPRY